MQRPPCNGSVPPTRGCAPHFGNTGLINDSKLPVSVSLNGFLYLCVSPATGRLAVQSVLLPLGYGNRIDLWMNYTFP